MTVSLEVIHRDLNELKKELEDLKRILLPEENISDEERQEIRRILSEMEKGNETRLEDVFKD
jgi:hypothetical protein